MEKFVEIWYYGFGLFEAEKLRADVLGVALPFVFVDVRENYGMGEECMRKEQKPTRLISTGNSNKACE